MDMIHSFSIDGIYHLIVIGSMRLAVAPIAANLFEVFVSETYPIFDTDEIVTLEAAIELNMDAKGKHWNLTNGLLSGLPVDLNLLIKSLHESRYFYYPYKITMDDETLFAGCGEEIIPMIGVTSKEYVERDSAGYYRRINETVK